MKCLVIVVTVILARYCEIGLKSTPVRRRFERLLKKNILDMLVADDLEALVTSMDSRYYVRSNDMDGCISSVKKVFGITSLSVAEECSSDMEDICDKVAEYSKGKISMNQSFAVRARRNGDHPYTSMDIGREAGSSIFLENESLGVTVDLVNPDKVFYIEVRNNRAYIFDSYVYCPGGLPLGCQGRVFAEVNDRRGLVSAWMMMKRGCRLSLSGDYEIDVLKRYDPMLHVLDQQAGEKAEWVLGRVMGSTISELSSDMNYGMPVYFPTIGMSDAEVDSLYDSIVRSEFKRH